MKFSAWCSFIKHSAEGGRTKRDGQRPHLNADPLRIPTRGLRAFLLCDPARQSARYRRSSFRPSLLALAGVRTREARSELRGNTAAPDLSSCRTRTNGWQL